MANPAGGKRPRSVLFVFLTGGLSHHDSFDMKPDAPDHIRGEFKPAATKTPGLQICELLPKLAQRSQTWSIRSPGLPPTTLFQNQTRVPSRKRLA